MPEASGIPVYCAYDEIAEITTLVPNPRNPNTHPEKQVQLLAKIIKNQGWRAPITVSNRSGFIVRGHGRLLAAQLLGVEQVPVDRQDYATEAEEWADLIADNRIAELAEMDDALLKDLLVDLNVSEFDIELTGFYAKDIDQLIAQFQLPAEIQEDDFDAEAEAAKIKDPITKPGDIWALGNHRVMCGDATALADVEKLMCGKTANMIFTDPPYNVDYTGKTEEALKIKNDKMRNEEFYKFLYDSFLNMFTFTVPGGAVYICHADSEGLNFRKALIESGWLMKQCIIWVKNSIVMGRQDYHWQHEPILYGWKPGSSHNWYSGRKESTVWNFDKPLRNAEHPTMKPVGIPAKAIQNSSKPGDIVLDLFGGSGSTLIAAEQTGRVSYLMEIDPIYCDVIILRWEQFTGCKAERLGFAA
ncbi:MAG: site-specific DNA-methyltransferase [Dehalobacter sp.]|nr:site-specific DNA-methyltransferase [Dehalobacter sp.]